MEHDINELITVEELCEILNIGRNAAYTLLNAGKLKAFRIGRVWKIPRLALEKFILMESNLE